MSVEQHVFHAHGADAGGRAVFSRKITRGKLLNFFASQPRCVIALEACGGPHRWARELRAMGHEVRLVAPAYVRQFVKRGKNDAVDAEAICEAAQRPSMRFVTVKSEEQQAAGLVFRTRDLLVKQRTQLGNAIRGHLTEYGWIAPKGASHLALLADLLEDGEMASMLPAAARPMFAMMIDMLAEFNKRIAALDQEIAHRAREDEVVRRLMTIPGIGPITATAIAALGPPAETFAKGRDFAAWLGLVPRQASTGGKQKLGSISKMGERTLKTAYHRQQLGGAPGEQARRAKGFMAGRHARAKTADAGHGCARQQNGPDRLGGVGESGGLQGSGDGGGIANSVARGCRRA